MAIKKDFLEIWNHVQGVMTETYFCPKLYLTRIPRQDVIKWMGEATHQLAPNSEFLSCCDLVNFNAFAKWILSNNTEPGNQNSQTQINFVALIINLALNLYNLDPEKYVRIKDDAIPSDDVEILPVAGSTKQESGKDYSSPSATKETPCWRIKIKPISQINQESSDKDDDIEIIPVEKKKSLSLSHPTSKDNLASTSSSSSVTSTAGEKIPRLQENDKITTTSKVKDPQSFTSTLVFTKTDLTLVDQSEPGDDSLLRSSALLPHNPSSSTSAAADNSVYILSDDEMDVVEVSQASAENSEAHESVVKPTSCSSELSPEIRQQETTRPELSKVTTEEFDNHFETVSNGVESEKEKEPSRSSEQDKAEDVSKTVDLNSPSTTVLVSAAECSNKNDLKTPHRDSVSVSLGKLIQVCIKLLTQEEYRVFTRKVSKYLNALPEQCDSFSCLTLYIDQQCDAVKKDEKNVFVYIKKIFDAMKKGEVNDKDEPETDTAPLKNVGDQCSKSDEGMENQVETENPEEHKSCLTNDVPKSTVNNEASEVQASAPGDKDVVEDKTLKEVLLLFLESCRKKLSSKQFNPRFKQILNLMNILDPTNLNSPTLIQFIASIGEETGQLENEAVLVNVDAVVREIQKYQKSNKRALDDEQSSSEPGSKKLCIESKKDVREETESKDTIKKECPNNEQETIFKRKVSLTPVVVEKKDFEPSTLAENIGSTTEVQSSAADYSKDLEQKKGKVSSKHIKKLEKALKACDKKIRMLEETEVDWDNEDDESNYVLCAKYKRRYMQLHKKIAGYKQLSDSLDRKSEKKFVCEESRYPEINTKIQKFINKTKEFPDFQDIRSLVHEANSELHLSSVQLHDEAENIFRSVGQRLKKRREKDDTEVMLSYLHDDQLEDPAASDEALNKVLVEQGEAGKKNLEKYLDDFYVEHVLNRNQIETADNDHNNLSDTNDKVQTSDGAKQPNQH